MFVGDRVNFAGDAMIGLNGNIISKAPLFTLNEIELVTATVDLEDIRVYKHLIRSRCLHGAKTKSFPRIQVCNLNLIIKVFNFCELELIEKFLFLTELNTFILKGRTV